MKGLTIFRMFGFRRMNRTCDFWAAIPVDVFQKNSTTGLNYCPSSVYPFVL